MQSAMRARAAEVAANVREECPHHADVRELATLLCAAAEAVQMRELLHHARLVEHAAFITMSMLGGSPTVERHLAARFLSTSMPGERGLTSFWRETVTQFVGRFETYNGRMRANILSIHFTSMLGVIFR
jgi:hypothetical protein